VRASLAAALGWSAVAACGPTPSPATATSPPGDGHVFTPSRVCTRGASDLVLVKAFGCDRAMTCTVHPRGRDLTLHVVTRQPTCKDSWPEVEVTCRLPPGVVRGRHRVTLGGAVVLETLEVREGGALAIDRCLP